MQDIVVIDMTASELFEAYYDCRKTKRNSASAMFFEERLERNLMDLYYELISGEYKPGKSTVFVVENPKIREVWAADFRDRIVHHLLYNRISDYFHRRFIHDSYACIPGKGTHRAVARSEHFARSVTQNYSVDAYVLQMDVANFFNSIDRHILDAIYTRHIPEGWWLDLCRTIIHHDPTSNCIVNSPARLMRKVPPHKSLFHSNRLGLPIGNLHSQLSANVYMNELDQHAKHVLKARRWIRYVDDIVVFSESADELNEIKSRCDDFLRDALMIGFHPNKTYLNKVGLGFDFVGNVIRPYARYVRQITVKRGMSAVEMLCEEGAPTDQIFATANSYFGIFRQADAYKERKKLARILRSHGHLVSPKLTRMLRGIPA